MSVVTLSRHSSDAVNAISNNTADEATNIPSAQADANSSTVSLVIGGDNQAVETEAGIGTVAYRKHTVTVELDNVSQYFLKFYGAEKLVPVDGGVNVEGIGTTPVTGKEIQQGTWGYGWDATGMVADEDMQYQTVPTTSSDLAGPEIIDNSLTFTGKLNFAANFPSNATLGNYTSTATLTLIATPKANTGIVNYWRTPEGGITAVDAGTDEMQGVGPDFCSDEVGEGWTVELRDNRGDSPVTYTIVKLRDGNCWMQQNLRLGDEKKVIPLTSGDTDLPEGETWELPQSQVTSASTWTTDSSEAMSRTGTEEYGNYYTWCAATAGSCTTARVSGTSAIASICPKGWKLPTGNTNGKFYNLLNGLSGSTVIASPYVFQPAGSIGTNGLLSGDGSRGYYWASTINDSTFTYSFYFSDSVFYPGINSGYRYSGFSVRCIYDQEPVGFWRNNANGKGSFNSELIYMQDITKANFTTKYCAKTNNDVAVGATVRLRDSRDKKTYNVVKLNDRNCWMQENLALSGSKVLTPYDSNWTLPADTSWSSNNNGIFITTGKLSLSGWRSDYGNYYSWCSATAGTCSDYYNDGGIASGSICPKGWRLPTGKLNTDDFYVALNGLDLAAI